MAAFMLLKDVDLEGDMNADLCMGILLLGLAVLVPILVLQPGRRREFSAPQRQSVHHHS